MNHALRFLTVTLITLAVAVVSPATGRADWIAIRNDTGKTITVRESVLVKGEVRRGKATSLLPGETFREFIPGPVVKRIEITESRDAERVIWSGALDCRNEKQSFAVTALANKLTVSASPPRR